MKAIVQDRYGPADVLELRDVATPWSATPTSSSGCGQRAAAPTCGTS